jgi:putative transposase
MSSYRQILYHIIFRTKSSKRTLVPGHMNEFFAYTMGIIKSKNCILYRINAVEDHVHFLSDLHPGVALADYMREIKASTSHWIKDKGIFPYFAGWADGYAALTYSWQEKDTIINYIKNQQEHHKKEPFLEEYSRLLKEHGIKIDDSYFP